MRTICLMLALQLTAIPGLPAQNASRPPQLIGTWQLLLNRNLKTGKTDSIANHADVWMQFTASHFSVLSAERGRKGIPFTEEEKLSADSLVRLNYSKVWAESNNQLFQARAGTYTFDGKVVRSKRVVALQPITIGLEETLNVVRLDAQGAVFRTPPDSTGLSIESVYRRLD